LRALIITEDAYLKELFEKAGYSNNFIIAGYDSLFGVKPDALILDLSNNMELVDTVSKSLSIEDIPIIAVINITQVGNKKLLNFGKVKDILVKPVVQEEISNKLELLKIYIDFINFRRVKEGLYREELEQLLEIEFNRYKRYNVPFSFMIIRLDDFEKLSELKTPQDMDNLFKEILDILRNMLRSSDFVGKFSEKEFGVLLTHTNLKGAFEVANRIQKRIKKHRFVGFSDVNITVSIGLAQISDSIKSVEEFMDATKIALSRAVRNGKGKVAIFDSWVDYSGTSN
jgi:diguanylate cyclase (GGDEF)-like protein